MQLGWSEMTASRGEESGVLVMVLQTLARFHNPNHVLWVETANYMRTLGREVSPLRLLEEASSSMASTYILAP